MTLPLLRTAALAALLLTTSSFPLSLTAQESAATAPASATATASLSVQGRPTVYSSVVALRGKSFSDPRIVIIATVKPLTEKQLQQVFKANAEETQTLEGDASYIKASFKKDGTLRYLVGDGGGAVFSKKNEADQTILKGKATITGDHIKGEVTLNEPGDYAKEAKLTFDLPILPAAVTKQ